MLKYLTFAVIEALRFSVVESSAAPTGREDTSVFTEKNPDRTVVDSGNNMLAITNHTQNPMPVGNYIIPPGETRLLNRLEVPGHQHETRASPRAPSLPESDPKDNTQALFLQEEALVIEQLPNLAAGMLEKLAELEKHSAAPRQGVLDAISAEFQRRRDGNQSAQPQRPAEPANRKTSPPPQSGDPDVPLKEQLKLSLKDLKPLLKDFSDKDLNRLGELEAEGANRTGTLAAVSEEQLRRAQVAEEQKRAEQQASKLAG